LAHFPLYVVEALCVEIAFITVRQQAIASLLSGVLIGTVGIAAEWLWTQVWGLQPWQAGMLPMMWVPLVGAVAASTTGLAFATRLLGPPAVSVTPRRWLGILALAATVAVLAIPAPRTGMATELRITQWPVSRAVTVVDRNGQKTNTHEVMVSVALSPPSAARDVDWFRVAAWQGGGVVNARLVPSGPGVFLSERSVPVGGDWKAIVYYARGEVIGATPIAMPAEPDQKLPAISLQPVRHGALNNAQLLLMRENHGGPALVADIAYAVFGLTVAVWLSLLAIAAGRLASWRSARGSVSPFGSALGVHRPLRRHRRSPARIPARLR
jgi:hypothetical protein